MVPSPIGQQSHDGTKDSMQFASKKTCIRDFWSLPIQYKCSGFPTKEGEPDSSSNNIGGSPILEEVPDGHALPIA